MEKPHEIQSKKRILVLGDAGRGKTSLAHELHAKLGIEQFSTDDFFWKEKYITKAEKESSVDAIKKIYSKDNWIVEGTTRHLLEPGLERADLILHLTFNNIFEQWLVLFMRFLRRPEETLSAFFGLAHHVFNKRFRRGSQKGSVSIAEMVSPYQEKVVTLSSFREIDEHLN